MALRCLNSVVLVVGLGVAMSGHARSAATQSVATQSVATQSVANPSVAIGQITVSDGPVEVLRGRARFDAREGMLLYAQDILRTSSNSRVARLELPQGMAIDLGPSTQLLLHPPMTPWPGKQSALGYLAVGWAKLNATAQAPDAANRVGLATASVHATPDQAGVVLLHAQAGDSAAPGVFAFAEAGNARLTEYAAIQGKTNTASPKVMNMLLSEGQAYRRTEAQAVGNAAGEVLARASASMLVQVPSSLRVTLPMRAGTIPTVPTPASMGQPVESTELTAWARVAEPLRAHLAQRFSLAATAPQRAAVAVASAERKTITARKTVVTRPLVASAKRAPERVAVPAPQKDTGGTVAMLLERDVNQPNADAGGPVKAIALGALPVTNTRLPEAAMAVAPMPAIPALMEVAKVTPPAATPVSWSSTLARGRGAANR